MPKYFSNDERFEEEPQRYPVDRFAHLPEPTRKFLESLREEDIKLILEAAKFVQSIRSAGRFSRWLLLSVVGLFVMAGQLGEAIQKLWHWMSIGGRP